jgi:nucleotide-binding universal stress UspA family protein
MAYFDLDHLRSSETDDGGRGSKCNRNVARRERARRLFLETEMFKHILIPTDGSGIAESAARQAIELAKAIGATVTAVAVSPRFHVLTYDTQMLEDTREQFSREVDQQAKVHLDGIRRMAAECGVPCHVQHRVSDEVDDAILDVARERHCDAIAMGSHGRRGLGALLGSVTRRVLANAQVPVIVWR